MYRLQHPMPLIMLHITDNCSIFRIGLSLVAIHTTSDLLQEVMIRIAQHPELFEVLRNEIVEVLGRDGLKKTALYNLKTMDSVLKESQRLKTNSLRKPKLSFLKSKSYWLTEIP